MTDPYAWNLQQKAIAAGDLLIWTVCTNITDYPPGIFTARPHSVRANAPCDFVLTATTLEALRDLLPPGLFRMPREPADLPVIVELWI